jgi:hypothetical protein
MAEYVTKELLDRMMQSTARNYYEEGKHDAFCDLLDTPHLSSQAKAEIADYLLTQSPMKRTPINPSTLIAMGVLQP